jgi:hypothetical protein
MTKQQKDAHRLLTDYILQKLGATELNVLMSAVEVEDSIEVVMEDGSIQLLTVTITDLSE